jgi:predicted AAA+ superfamily ATPase
MTILSEAGMYIDRHIAKVIERQRKKKKVIILTGPRQAGKSTLMKTMLNQAGVAYISLDNPTIRENALENPSRFLDMNKPPIIIDEIQKAPLLFEYIKEIVDGNDKTGQYYLTGSQSFRLMKGVTESLAGRAGIVNMLGLSLREINSIGYSGSIEEIIHKGSFPVLYETEHDLDDWADYYSSYLQSYVEKDVRELTNVQNMSAFIKFVKAAAALSGEQLSYTTLAGLCGMDVNTVKRWISILETSGLVYLLQPYYNNYGKRLVKTPKLYLLDTGLICYLGGWNTPQQLVSGARWGHIFESYVVGEIIKNCYNDGKTLLNIYYYRDKEKNEIDLLIEEGDSLRPVEIKTTGDPDKSMVKNFDLLKNIPGKTIAEGSLICLAKTPMPLTDNVTVLPLMMI